MGKLISMEWLKLRTRPLPWGLYITVLLLSILFFGLTYLAAQFTSRQTSAINLMSNLQQPGGIYEVITNAGGLSALAISIVAAILTGQEFSLGTVRMLLVRGTGRYRLWLGKALLMLILAVIVSVINALLGFILSSIADAATQHHSAWTLGETLMGTLQLIAASTLSIWTYALFAMLMATLFRSPIAGVAVAFGFRILELIATPLLIIALRSDDGILKFVGQLDYFLIGNNVDALYHYAAPVGWSGINVNLSALFSISGPQSLIYMLVAAALFLGLTLYLMKTRDITS